MRQKYRHPSVELVVYKPEDDMMIKGIKDTIRGATFVTPQGRLTAVQVLTQLRQVPYCGPKQYVLKVGRDIHG